MAVLISTKERIVEELSRESLEYGFDATVENVMKDLTEEQRRAFYMGVLIAVGVTWEDRQALRGKDSAGLAALAGAAFAGAGICILSTILIASSGLK